MTKSQWLHFFDEKMDDIAHVAKVKARSLNKEQLAKKINELREILATAKGGDRL